MPQKLILDKHPKAEALIFDLDGTLSNSLPVHIRAWKHVAEYFNCFFNENMMEEMTGRPTIDFALRVLQENKRTDIAPEQMIKMKHKIFAENLHLLKPIQAVVSLVDKYHGIIPLSVGTGANTKSALLQLQILGISDKFEAIVTAEDVKTHKPAPETFLRCAELMHVSPNKCEVFEDGILGMQAAEAAGMFITDVRPYYTH